MFPFDLDDEDVVIELEDTETTKSDYEVDFTTGELTGKVITGLPAVIQWIRLTLGTEKYYYNQFTWDYGSELVSLIGQSNSKEYVDSEVARMLTDTLSQNEDIDSISDLVVDYDKDTLTATFTVNTVYGSEEVAVNV